MKREAERREDPLSDPSVIGLFLVNGQDKLAFAQYGAHRKIARFRFHQDTSMCMAEMASGEEESFDDVMPDMIRVALQSNAAVLVSHMSDDGRVLVEYDVPVLICPRSHLRACQVHRPASGHRLWVAPRGQLARA
jgi:hypothetical protein